MTLPPFVAISPRVSAALAQNKPIVALESTIIAHGMPYPENLATAESLEALLESQGVVPATIAIMAGQLKIGLSQDELRVLAQSPDVEKVSRRDLARVLAQGRIGATTVASTLMACHIAGIRIFATGGIGGAHREAPQTWDVSADLRELALAPVTCVSAGVKSILDIPKTLEVLETLGVPVITYRSSQFPAFYCRDSGEASPMVAEELSEVAALMKHHWQLPQGGGCLLAVPIPDEYQLDAAKMKLEIDKACAASAKQGVFGKAITPFLLKTLANATGGLSLKANIALVKNNVAIAAKLAKEFYAS